MRIGERIVGALDDRQQCELERQAAALEFGRDVRQVALCAGKDALQVVRVPDEPVEFAADARIVLGGQRESVTQTLQHIGRCEADRNPCRIERQGLQRLRLEAPQAGR